MTHGDWIEAARLALTDRAALTGITRIQALGLDFGPREPLRFVVAGDLHIDIDRVFLHRTRRLPPTDEVGVTPAGAYIAYCATARVIDAIKVGDWLLHHGHMTVMGLRELALHDRWRDGAREAMWVSRRLDPGARSLPESEVRALMMFAGLPAPEVNAEVTVDGRLLILDLYWRTWRVALEYEGGHHQTEREQYLTDIDRYGVLRAVDVLYLQATREHLSQPRALVMRVHDLLCRRDFDGPAPVFGRRWADLFESLSVVVGSRER